MKEKSKQTAILWKLNVNLERNKRKKKKKVKKGCVEYAIQFIWKFFESISFFRRKFI